MLANSTSGRQVSRSAFSLLRMNKNCIRFFLACLMLTGIGIVAGVAQTVMSNQPDYAPLSSAVFYGEGFSPNESITLKVKNLSKPCNTVSADSSYLPWTVVANEFGEFQTTWKVCDCYGDSLRLKASGSISGLIAYAYFTDGGANNSIDIASTSAVVENFNGIASMSTNLPTGWSMQNSSTAVFSSGAAQTTQYALSNTSPTAGGTYVWGSTDKSVGAMTSGSFSSPNNLMAKYENTNANPISQLTVSYAAKRFRINSAAASIQFYYSLNGSTWTSVSSGDIATASFPTGSSAYTWATPTTINVTGISIGGLNIAPGGFIYLRWNINTTGSNSQGIGIDDVSVTASFAAVVTAPTCIALPGAPGNGATGIAASGTTLSWSNPGTATRYDVFLGTTPGSLTLVGSNLSLLSYSTGALNPGTTYYWKIVPKNDVGSATGCSEWSFTTACPSYPAITLDNQLRCGDGNVTFTVNNPGAGYTIEWSNDGITVDNTATGNTNTKFITVGTPVTVWVRFSYSTVCKSAWVSATGSAGVFSNTATLLLENFGTGTSLPGGWANSGSGTWDIENSASSSGYSGASGESNATADNNTAVNASLTSKTIDFTGATNGILTFGLRRSSVSFVRSLAIDVSTNNGGSFVTVQTIAASAMGAANWSVQTVDLGSLINNASQVKIKFRITGTAGTGGPNVRIDDIKLTGAVSSPASISKVENCDGTVTLTSSEGAGYAWTPGGSASRSISVNATGNYSVTVTGATYGCTSTASTAVSVLPVPIVATANVTSPKCFGESGTVVIAATGGDGVYTGTGTFTVAAGANYNYTVTDSKGCISNVISGAMPAPTQVVASSQFNPILCIGSTTLVTVSATGGTGSYTGAGTFTKPAGLYNFTVIDENGCSAMTSATITEPSEIIINEVITNVSCNGKTDGSVNLSISGGTPSAKLLVSENFDGLSSSGSSASWANNSTIANWYASVSGSTPNTYLVGTGTNTAGAIYSFGVAGVNALSDRALGSIASGNTNDILGAWKISNTTTQTLTTITVNYTGEQWRNGGNATAQSLNFDYQVNASSITAGSWTSVPALNFTSLKNTSAASELDGNDPSNRSLKTATFSISLPPGQAIWLRWTDVNDAGNDHGLAIDDLSAELTAGSGNVAPYTYSWSSGATTQNLSSVGAGTYTVTVTDDNNCSKQKTVTITQPDPITTSESATACDSYTWPLNGQVYTTTGTYTYVYQNANGCNVTASLVLTINKSTTSEASVTACDQYVWHGVTYTMGGDYTYSSTNAAGCPHVETLHLTLNKSTTSEASVTACDQYVWHDVTYTMGGDYTYSSTNAAGCLHVETLHLTINNSTTSEASVTACDQYVWHDVTFTMGGDYTYSSTNAAGCPHVETLHLTINNSTTSEASVTACDQYVWHGVTYTMSGDYTYSSTNAAGCSHVETLHLTINKSTTSEASVTACDQYVWHDVTYTMDGDYTYSSTNAAGCPHVETLHLTINKSTTSEASVTACDQYVWHEVTYTMGGDYTYNSTNVAGCPHVETLHLTINKSTSHTTTITVCTSYTWSGPLGDNQTYTEAGTYTHTSTNADGCTHTEKLILSINPPIVFSATAHQPKCAGDKGSVTLGTPAGGTGAIHFNGTPTTNLAPGTYTYTAIDELGCASSVSVVIDPAPAALMASASAGTISCFGGTATLLVSASGGTLPYSGTGSFVVGAGPYAYPVTDGNGCVSTASGNISQPNALSIVCSNSNPNLYYGYINGQSTIIKGSPIGGKAPYTVSITMNRKLVCDSVTASGDEFWTPSGGISSNNICSTVNSAPVSTLGGIAETGSYSLEATLMKNATFTITVTDANGCTATCSTFVKAEDVRCFSGNSGNAKIAICHKTGSTKNPCTAICVDQSALAEHLAHGDYMGSCTPNCVAPAIVAAAATTVEHHDAEEHATKLELKVMNNPAFNGSAFKLRVLSNNQQELIHLKVMDMNGRPVESKNGIRAGQTIEIGRSYIGGMYVVEAIQAGQRVVVKLIRQ